MDDPIRRNSIVSTRKDAPLWRQRIRRGGEEREHHNKKIAYIKRLKGARFFVQHFKSHGFPYKSKIGVPHS